MEEKQSHIGGLPTALILFTIALILLIDLPAWFWGFAPLQQQIAGKTVIDFVRVPYKVVVTPTATPTATPSAQLAPVKTFVPQTSKSRVVTPVK